MTNPPSVGTGPIGVSWGVPDLPSRCWITDVIAAGLAGRSHRQRVAEGTVHLAECRGNRRILCPHANHGNHADGDKHTDEIYRVEGVLLDRLGAIVLIVS